MPGFFDVGEIEAMAATVERSTTISFKEQRKELMLRIKQALAALDAGSTPTTPFIHIVIGTCRWRICNDIESLQHVLKRTKLAFRRPAGLPKDPVFVGYSEAELEYLLQQHNKDLEQRQQDSELSEDEIESRILRQLVNSNHPQRFRNLPKGLPVDLAKTGELSLYTVVMKLQEFWGRGWAYPIGSHWILRLHADAEQAACQAYADWESNAN